MHGLMNELVNAQRHLAQLFAEKVRRVLKELAMIADQLKIIKEVAFVGLVLQPQEI